MPHQEIAKEETREAVEAKILLAPDVDEFLKSYSTQKGSVSHCVNAIVRLYRDRLPAKARAVKEPSQAPAKEATKQKAAAA